MNNSPHRATETAADHPVDLRVVSRNASPAELAAVTAVLTAALDELANDLAVDSVPHESAWQRSQRPVRAPLRPGPGAWQRF